MCGIAGFYGKDGAKALELLRELKHRGPDGEGIYEGDLITLVHRRLAILDISGGAQPMNKNGLTIVFNGEIYNHLELRGKNKDFKTRSDTETLLYLYEKHAEKMLEKLDGMFAFAIYNERDKTIFLARDRFGKKPLYFTFQNGFAFASEINVLRKTARFEIDRSAIEAYLSLGFIPFDRSAFEKIVKLPAAGWLKARLDTFEVESGRYFSIAPFYSVEKYSKANEIEAIDAVEEALKKSVDRRLESSDVEVGCFLSGGIDSSLIAFYASKKRENLKTFTVRIRGAIDESAAAGITAKQLGTDHRAIEISPNLKEDLEGILARFGEPFFDSSAIPAYYVARAAKEYVKTALSGDGADELFAGYRRYAAIKNGWVFWAKKFKFLAKILPKPRDKFSAINYLWRLFDIAGSISPAEFWIKSRNALKTPINNKNPIMIELSDYFSSLPNISPLSLAMITDQDLLLFSDLLPKIDICSMANSLEVRSPFLSREISSLAPTLSDDLKISGTKTKYILRKLAAKRLGNKTAGAPKRGFEIPLVKWVENDLAEMIGDRVNSPNAFWRGFLDKSALNNAVSREEKAKLVWSLYCLEAWKQNLN